MSVFIVNERTEQGLNIDKNRWFPVAVSTRHGSVLPVPLRAGVPDQSEPNSYSFWTHFQPCFFVLLVKQEVCLPAWIVSAGPHLINRPILALKKYEPIVIFLADIAEYFCESDSNIVFSGKLQSIALNFCVPKCFLLFRAWGKRNECHQKERTVHNCSQLLPHLLCLQKHLSIVILTMNSWVIVIFGKNNHWNLCYSNKC